MPVNLVYSFVISFLFCISLGRMIVKIYQPNEVVQQTLLFAIKMATRSYMMYYRSASHVQYNLYYHIN